MDEEPQQIEDDSTSTREIGEVRQWLQRVAGRSLGDVRVHDSTQAGELARRLGARAFTAGRHVYVRPELVRPFTRRGAALLAHEMWHAAGEPTLPNGSAATSMPLLSPASRSKAGGVGDAAGMAVQRQADTAPVINVQRAQPASQGSGEASAQSVEAAAAQQTQEPEQHKQEGPDPEELAERVYRLIVRDLIVDRERASY